MIKNIFLYLLSFILLFFIIVSFFIENYNLTYTLSLLFFISSFFTFKNLTFRILVVFYFLYYSIPLLNITEYRGTIEFKTLFLYTSMIIISLIPTMFSNTLSLSYTSKKKKIYLVHIFKSEIFYYIYFIHLSIVYITLFFIIAKYGNIFFNQDMRFMIGGQLLLIARSIMYTPLIVFSFTNFKMTYINFILYFILPIFPGIFLGSRGVVIIIIFGVLIIKHLKLTQKKYSISLDSNLKKIDKKILILSSCISIGVVYLLFYMRRIGSSNSEFLSPSEILLEYFNTSNPIFYLIVPLYLNLRETIGLSNSIIVDHLKNNTFVPLFVSELLTLLPGKQIDPGTVMGNIFGFVGNIAGLTPGILGGLYLDFKEFSIFIPIIFTFLIKKLYSLSINNDIYKILYSITLIQFLHLFHRGFIKPEYLFSYFIILFYIFIGAKIKVYSIKNEK